MEPGCTIIGIVYAKAGRRDELKAILQGFVAPTRAEPGCIEYHMHQDEADPDLFMFYENWRSKGDLDEHLEMPHLRVLRERADELLGRPVEIRYYRMVSSFGR